MTVYVYPGQGAQFPGMGKELYENNVQAKDLFEKANDILGFRITDIMFEGSAEDLKQTKVTQPAIFLHSVILSEIQESFNPDMVAGHSLGEFSALVANKALSFEDALKLVSKQLVISGSNKGIEIACEKLIEAGARRALPLQVGGAFHSPLMEPARAELAEVIMNTEFKEPTCPVYQNATAQAATEVEVIKKNLVDQLTSPVRWTQSVQNMVADGGTHFVESGPGKVLQGLVKKVHREAEVSGL
jgi:[acyl-carrier-protein] S-malonyltransferase